MRKQVVRKKKVCVVIPTNEQGTDTHFFHRLNLIREVEKTMNVYIISADTWIVLMFFRMLSARIVGYRDIYIHYSYKGALIAYFLGARVFYWNCGMPWLYTRDNARESLFRFILSHTILVTGTERLKSEYALQYGLSEENIRVVPNAVYSTRFNSITREQARIRISVPQDARVVLFSHHLSTRKGADLMPDIVRGTTDISGIYYIIVGSGPEEEQLKERVLAEGLTKYIRFVGAVPNRDMVPYFVAADVFIMPSEEEGAPHALLDAMAAGVPFVASRVGSVEDVIPPDTYKYLLPYGASNHFADAVRLLLENTGERERISALVKRHSLQYDTKNVAPQFIALFD